MDGGMRFILVLLVLTTLLSIGVGARFFLLEEEMYQKYVRTEQTLTEKNFVLKDKLEAVEKSKSELEKQLETLKAKLGRAIETQATLNREYQASRVKMDNKLDILAKEKAGLEEKIKQIQSEQFFAETLKEKTILEVEVKSLKDKLASQETQIRNLSSERANLQKRLKELKGVRQANEEVLKEAREVSDLLSRRLARESQNSMSLSENLERIRRENSALQQQLVEAIKKIELSSEKKEDIELSPIMVKAASPFPTTPSPAIRGGLTSVKTKSFPEGRILSVNNKYKFVIINLGQEDGIKPGMSFDVYRDSSDIGRIEVLEVHPGISAADIMAVRGKASLRPDDIVKVGR